MPLFKRRPRIRLFTPRMVRAGEPFDVRVELECTAAVPVDAVNIAFETHGTYPEALGQASALMRAKASVWSGGEMPEGVTRLRARFVLPPETPGTYLGTMLRINHAIHVHVDIPWWPDARQSFVQPVQGVMRQDRPTRPQLWVSKLEGPHDARPYLEASLASGIARPGGTLRGSVAFAHTDRFDYRGLKFTLVAREGVLSGKTVAAAYDRAVRSWRMPLREVHEQRPTDFLLRLPDHSLSAGFEFAGTFVRWYLDVAADVPWTRDPSLRIPLAVATEPPDPHGPRPTPVPVGTERLALVWQNVAKLAGLRWTDERLEGSAGRVGVDVRRERIGSKIQLVVRLEPAGDVRLRVLAGRRRHGHAALTARDRDHNNVLLEILDPAFESVSAIRLVDLEGDVLRFEAPTAGVRQEDVRAVAVGAVAMANALDQALDRMDAPHDLTAARVEAWRRAARTVGGRWFAAAVRIDAPLPARLAELGPGASASRSAMVTSPGILIRRRYGTDDRVAALEIEAITPLVVDRRHHARWTRGDPPLPVHAHHAAPRRWLGGLGPLWPAINTFEVGARGLTATVPPDTDPSVAAELAQALVRALETILGVDDPYR